MSSISTSTYKNSITLNNVSFFITSASRSTLCYSRLDWSKGVTTADIVISHDMTTKKIIFAVVVVWLNNTAIPCRVAQPWTEHQI
jgi:hypothetical protein